MNRMKMCPAMPGNSFLSFARVPVIFFLAAVLLAAGITPASGALSRRPATSSVRLKRAALQHQRYRDWSALNKTSGTVALSPLPQKAEIRVRNDIRTSSTIYFYDAMESGTNGWSTVAYHGTDIWHQTTLDANSPLHSWWAGVESQGSYNTGGRIDAALISPSIDLTAAAGPVTLLFTENYSTEGGWDYCMVDISSDAGATWNHLRGGYAESRSGDTYGWTITSLDLSSYAGTSVNIRFYFDTGDSLVNDFRGWFVDNVTVFDHSGTIAGAVYFDWNQNGARDEGDGGLRDWYIRAEGPITLTLRSGWNGSYEIPLPLGSYQVSELISPPWTETAPPASVWNITLDAPGGRIDSLDFGNWRQAGKLQGVAFDDINRDSAQNGSDTLLTNHEILLLNAYDQYIGGTPTDSAGSYSFVVFGPATYTVTDNLTGGRVSTVPGGNGRYTVSMPTEGQNFTGLNFGSFQLATTGSIAGYVFDDLNKDGIVDPREPAMAGIWIQAGGGSTERWAQTDSSGNFLFDGLLPGVYTVRAPLDYTWMRSYPDTVTTIDLAEGETKSGLVIGVYRLPLSSIRGTVYNDLNRNGVWDTLEPPLPGWNVSSDGPEPGGWDGQIWTTSDSAGHYFFQQLLSGVHTISYSGPPHWRTTIPSGFVIDSLADYSEVTGLDLPGYLLVPGSISGNLFDDLNKNEIRDSGEAGLGGWPIQLTGSANVAAVTGDDGSYRFDSLWTGSYKLNTVLRNRWRQTVPASLAPYFINLADEENRASVDFGVVQDSAFSLSFRTFIPESLALSRDIKGKFSPVALKRSHVQFRFSLTNTDVKAATALTVKLKVPVRPGTLTVSSGSWSIDTRGTLLNISFTPSMLQGDSVIVEGIGTKATLQIIRSTLVTFEDASSAPVGAYRELKNEIQFPMPNALNALSAGAGVLLQVGLGASHSVVHLTYKDVMKSLLDSHGGPAVGPERCLGLIAGTLKPIAKARPLRYLKPTQANNRMFSEAIALKTNLRASELWITPPGLGKLIFRDSTDSPYNGLSIKAIAAKLDTAMSAFDPKRKVSTPAGTVLVGGDTCICTFPFFQELYRVVRMIDSAFSGPVDTVSFANGLVFNPVRSLDSIPYLELDSSFSALASAEVRPQVIPEVPEEFSLSQNYPNPFNPSTTIEFYLTEPSIVTLKIYNTLGQEVAALVNNEALEDGWQQATFSTETTSLASGVYYYRLVAQTIADEDNPVSQKYTMVKKMMLLK